MSETNPVIRTEQAYRPSWIDHFNNWVQKLPVRSLLFFVVAGFMLVVVQVLFLALDGGLQTTLLPIIIFNGFFVPFLMGLIYLLDRQAVAALDALRPALDTAGEQFQQYRYLLSHMPARAPLFAGVALVVVVILMERLGTVPAAYATLDGLPRFAVIFQIVDKGSAFLFGTFIYHTVRQLRLIHTIHLHHTRINLFELAPLQSFSRVTAITAVGLVTGVYGWLLLNPELLTGPADPLIFLFVGLMTILAVAVFVLPLLSVHTRLETEKKRQLAEIDRHFERLFSEFNQGLLDRDDPLIESLNGTIASLEIQRSRIAAVPTWPWRPETAQFTLTAITVPLVLSLLPFFLELLLSR
jgi:hypothetical protein